MRYLVCIVAQHFARRWRGVSSSSPQAGHSGSSCICIIARCLLSVQCPVNRPTKIRRSCFLNPRAKCVSLLSGPCKNILAWRQPSTVCQHLWHSSKFQRVSLLGFITAATSLSGSKPNFARCLAISWATTLNCESKKQSTIMLSTTSPNVDWFW